MPRIYMVRHGHAAAGFGESKDPGLDAAGNAQATAVCEKFRGLGPLRILSSPLARTQQTAAPLAALWNQKPVIMDAVTEIPSPKGMALDKRAVWLRELMAGSWRDAAPELAAWREHCIATVTDIAEDSVVFSHYVAINVLMGGAVSDDRVIVFSPGYCSVTVFDNSGGKLKLVDKGDEAALTKVN